MQHRSRRQRLGLDGAEQFAYLRQRRLQLDVADDDRFAILETRCTLYDPHAKPGKTLRRINGRDGGDHATHMRLHLGKIDRDILRADAERT